MQFVHSPRKKLGSCFIFLNFCVNVLLLVRFELSLYFRCLVLHLAFYKKYPAIISCIALGSLEGAANKPLFISTSIMKGSYSPKM